MPTSTGRQQVTDYEMTALCAKAMGYEVIGPGEDLERTTDKRRVIIRINERTYTQSFGPLINDAQAMALVKKFSLTISGYGIQPDGDGWFVFQIGNEDAKAESNDLNRAIVECVAKMHSQLAAPNVGTQEEK